MFWTLHFFCYLCKTNEKYNRKNHIYEKSNPKSYSFNPNLVYSYLFCWVIIKCYIYSKLKISSTFPLPIKFRLVD